MMAFNSIVPPYRLHSLASALLCLAVFARPAAASFPDPAPPLPPPGGTIVRVSTEPQLQAAVRNLTSGTTILIAPGTYRLTSTLNIGNRSLVNVALRGETDLRDDVVLVGPGMTNASYGSAPHGIWTGNGVQGILIANLTVRDFYFHPLILNAGTQQPHLYNVRLMDGGEQLLKSNPDSTGKGVDNGVVEYSVFDFTTTSRDYYTNGVDVLGGANWIIRNNLFRNIRAPLGQLAGPSILMWRGSSNTIVEGNTFINCQREIALGLVQQTPNDHTGGIIRNNFIYRDASVKGDAAVNVFDSPNTQVLHNSVLISGTYMNAIEYRFPDTTGVLIVNNLTDAAIRARDGATATLRNNYTTATPGMFAAPAVGDLHLLSSATAAIDAGVVVDDASTDWDGESRSAGGTPDIGADELITVVVNKPPTVALTSPQMGAEYAAGSSLVLAANASDADGFIEKVDFFKGSTLIGTVTTAPYTKTWENVPEGTYTLTAVAEDNDGARTSSASVTVTVMPGGTQVLRSTGDAYVRDGAYADTNYGKPREGSTPPQLLVRP